jgi:hypothetical protein
MSLRTALVYSVTARNFVGLGRICSAFRPFRTPSAAFNTSSATLSSKNKDKRSKKPSSIDKLIEELDEEDDDDEDDQPKPAKAKGARSLPSEEGDLPETPAAKFIEHFHLNKKKEGKGMACYRV